MCAMQLIFNVDYWGNNDNVMIIYTTSIKQGCHCNSEYLSACNKLGGWYFNDFGQSVFLLSWYPGSTSRHNGVWQPTDFHQLPAFIDNPD